MITTLVIPQRGRNDLTLGLLQSLHRHDPLAGVVETIIVNDHPADPVSEALELHADQIVETGGVGWTAAVNAGIAAAQPGLIVLLNNDVLCHGPWIEQLENWFEQRQESSIVGVLSRTDPECSHELLEGWCLVFRRSLWKRLGGFDERMKLYFSDTDFQARAVEDGTELCICNLPLRHLGHQTAHDPVLCPDRRQQWQADQTAFRAKRPA